MSNPQVDSNVETFIGVVCREGRGAVRQGQRWTLVVTCEHWRIRGERINSSKLVVTRDLVESEINVVMAAFPVNAMVAFEARFTSPGRVYLENVIGAADDDELRDPRADSQEPESFTDDYFGTFDHDDLEGFTAKTAWGGSSVDLVLMEQNASPEELLRFAREVWAEQDRWSDRLRAFLVDKLLPIKNTHWIEPGESPVKPTTFLDSVRLRRVVINPDGLVDFVFDAGTMFEEHEVVVSGTIENGPSTISLQG